MTQCPNCGTRLPDSELRFTPSLAIRLGVFAYGMLCWAIILYSALTATGTRQDPNVIIPATTGLLANPVVQTAVIAGAVAGLGIAVMEAISMNRRKPGNRCDSCGHTWA
jgi:hypothetical protein